MEIPYRNRRKKKKKKKKKKVKKKRGHINFVDWSIYTLHSITLSHHTLQILFLSKKITNTKQIIHKKYSGAYFGQYVMATIIQPGLFIIEVLHLEMISSSLDAQHLRKKAGLHPILFLFIAPSLYNFSQE